MMNGTTTSATSAKDLVDREEDSPPHIDAEENDDGEDGVDAPTPGQLRFSRNQIWGT